MDYRPRDFQKNSVSFSGVHKSNQSITQFLNCSCWTIVVGVPDMRLTNHSLIHFADVVKKDDRVTKTLRVHISAPRNLNLSRDQKNGKITKNSSQVKLFRANFSGGLMDEIMTFFQLSLRLLKYKTGFFFHLIFPTGFKLTFFYAIPLTFNRMPGKD